MKRRNFLKILGLGATAPAAAAAAPVAATLNLGNLGALGVAAEGADRSPPLQYVPDKDTMARRLLSLTTRSASQHDFHRRRTGVYTLDADLAVMRAPSLQWKIAEQRKRNYARELERDVGWLTAALAGWFDP